MLQSTKKKFNQYVIKSYHRNFKIYNEQRIPTSGPTVLYLNHGNYMLDAYVCQFFTVRKICVLGSIVMYNLPLFKAMNKTIDVIPISRPIDIAKDGKGTIEKVERDRVFGRGTQFLKLKPGQSIVLTNTVELKIKQVVSDEELIVISNSNQTFQNMGKFRVIPIHSHQTFFGQSWKRMNNGQCCMIFPQGRSHDTAQMMPIRTGLSNIILGAMEKYDIQVNMVPIAMHNYKVDNYRSEWTLEVGQPFKATHQMFQIYKKNPKEGVKNLAKIIDQRIRNIKIDLIKEPNISKVINLRRLQAVDQKNFKPKAIQQKLAIDRKMGEIVNSIRQQKQQNEAAFKQLDDFNMRIQQENLDIVQVNKNSSKIADLLKSLILLILVVLKLAICAPAYVLYGLTFLIIKRWLKQKYNYYKEERKWVYVPGNHTDIYSSFKLGYFVVLAPFATFINTLIIGTGLHYLTDLSLNQIFVILAVTILLLPIYHEIFKITFDSLGKDYKRLRHALIRVLQQQKINQIKVQQEKLLQIVRPMWKQQRS